MANCFNSWDCYLEDLTTKMCLQKVEFFFFIDTILYLKWTKPSAKKQQISILKVPTMNKSKIVSTFTDIYSFFFVIKRFDQFYAKVLISRTHYLLFFDILLWDFYFYTYRRGQRIQKRKRWE
jgi:hypothetical protein